MISHIARQICAKSSQLTLQRVATTGLVSPSTAKSIHPWSFSRPFSLTAVAQEKGQLRFSERHEWARVDGPDPNTVTVGISKYAQNALGDVVYVQLPDVDSEVAAGDEVGAVESVKAASEIYTPVGGRVTEVNADLEEKPSLVNSACYDAGWLFRVRMSSTDEFNRLMTQEAYDKYLKEIGPDDGH